MNSKIIEQVKNLSFALYEPNYEVRTQHFTFVYYKGRILTIGRNNIKTNPLNLRNLDFRLNDSPPFKGTCSELHAAIKLKNKTNIDFGKISMINVRVDKNMKISNSKPCRFCHNLLAYLAPKNVFYSNDNGEFEEFNW